MGRAMLISVTLSIVATFILSHHLFSFWSALVTMFGPILQLQTIGLILPCFQKEEDRNARQAVMFLSGKRVLWVPTPSNGFSIGSLFRKESSEKEPQRCIMRITDNDDSDPVIFLEACAKEGDSFHLRLGKVDKVAMDTTNTDQVVLSGTLSGNGKNKTRKELLRFTMLGPDACPVRDDDRHNLFHHVAVLIEWERQRRVAADDPDNDDEDGPNFLQQRANQAKRFAQRELEMQTTKRDREKRKAKLVAASGGLKYTALALANRAS